MLIQVWAEFIKFLVRKFVIIKAKEQCVGQVKQGLPLLSHQTSDMYKWKKNKQWFI
jgi:hypothetical protein